MQHSYFNLLILSDDKLLKNDCRVKLFLSEETDLIGIKPLDYAIDNNDLLQK